MPHLSILVHHCHKCQYKTPVENSNTVWSDIHTCNHCGSRSLGLGVAEETNGIMDQAQHDELAHLFSHSMQLSQDKSVSQPSPEPGIHQTVVPTLDSKFEGPVPFVSTHYTPTAHIRLDCISEPAESPPPAYQDTIVLDDAAQILRQHLIDPSTLEPYQLHLFKNASYEQKLRLLELWRISPPNFLAGDQTQQGWGAVDRVILMDEPGPVPSEMGNHPGLTRPVDAEPYMTNGYQAALSAQATEPVYAAGAERWPAPNYDALTPQQAMADQYGMYAQVRNHAEWERMNREQMCEQIAVGRPPVGMGDDEMIM